MPLPAQYSQVGTIFSLAIINSVSPLLTVKTGAVLITVILSVVASAAGITYCLPFTITVGVTRSAAKAAEG